MNIEAYLRQIAAANPYRFTNPEGWRACRRKMTKALLEAGVPRIEINQRVDAAIVADLVAGAKAVLSQQQTPQVTFLTTPSGQGSYAIPAHPDAADAVCLACGEPENECECELRPVQVEAMLWLKERSKTTSDRREQQLICICMNAITDGWDDHNDYLPDWDHSCYCDLCKSYA